MRAPAGRRCAAATALLLLAACGGSSPEPATAAPAHQLLPVQGTPSAVVVLVPGGGWTSADPSGMVPLAQRLGSAGYAASTVTYRTGTDDAFFPVPVQDVLCQAAQAVREVDGDRPLVLLGHSAGAQLALLAALRPDLAGDCDAPAVAPAAVIGLAGPYDVRAIPDAAISLFGVPLESDGELWRDGDPTAWVGERPEVPVLLAHGDADTVVPLDTSRRAAAALESAGHRVSLQVLPGADHAGAYSADVVAPVVLDWLGEAVPTLGP